MSLEIISRVIDLSQLPQPKRGTGLKIGLTLSLIVVILLAISTILVYSTLQGQINRLQTDKNSLQNQIGTLQTDVTSLQNQLDDANSKLALGKSQNIFAYSKVTLGTFERKELCSFDAETAGYVVVIISNSDSDGIEAEVKFHYYSAGISLEDNLDLKRKINNYAGRFIFPVLPSHVTVLINTPSMFGSTLYVSAFYYY